MADKKISQLTPTTTVDLADRYALARGAGNFYVSYNTLKTNLSVNTGSFVKTVNAVAPDAVGNVAVSLASVETGLSSSFPALPSDGDVYVISGETATDRTGSNGQSFIYSSTSVDWFRLSGLDEAGNDARYVNISGDTMTGDLILNGNPITSNQAVNKAYVDGLTTNGTDGQTIRFNGTTPVANSVLFNNGTNIGIGTTNPEELVEIRRLVSAGNDNFALQLTNPLTTADSRIGILFADNTNTGANRDGAAIQVSNSNVNGRGHLTFGPVQNMTMTEVMRITQDQKVGIGTDTPSTKLEVDGTGKFGGQLDMSTNKITNVVDPTAAQDAATKQYTDLFYDSSSFNSSGNILQLHKGNSTIDSITIVSSSYAVTASHAITASSVLHLEQDVFISGTLFQSGSIEMNAFTINNLEAPTASLQAANKGYVDSIKLDQQYPIFDLSLSESFLENTPSYGERTFTGIAVYSGSRSFLYGQPNGSSTATQTMREWDSEAEEWKSTYFASVNVKRYMRGVTQFISGSDIYLNVLHGEGGIYTVKWEGSTLTAVQNITTPSAGEVQSDRFFTLSETDNEEGLAVYNELNTTDWVAYKWRTGSFDTTEYSVSASPSNVSQAVSTCVLHYNGDYYFNTWDETNDQASIYKFEYSTDTFTKVVTLPTQAKSAAGSYLASKFWKSDETLYLASGTEEVETEVFEIDVTNGTYKSLGKSPYVIEALGMGILGESNKTNVGVSYFGGSNPSNNTMQYFKFDPSSKTITDLGTKSISAGAGPILSSPTFLESNGELFPTTPNYRRFLYTTHKLEKDLEYKEGTLLLATNSNWKRSGQVSGSIQLPSGNTSERPSLATTGSLRFNSETNYLEYKDNSSWQPAATKAYVDSLSVGTAWAGGYLSGQGAYGGKYDLTQTFNSNNGDVSWSTANDEWALTEAGTYLISTNGYWQDVNPKTIEIRYNTTANQGATTGTLAASQAADTTARRWDFFTRLTITSTVYLWVHNLSGTGIVRNWKIQIQRLY